MEYSRNCEIKTGVEFPEGMQRIALGLEYYGADFNGFQRQSSTANTVQEHLEKALSKVADEELTLVCAGRTDAGVHASEQVVHFDTMAIRPDKAWVLGVNTNLPDTIRVSWVRAVPESFHARFSARSRTYRYVFRSAPVRSAILGKSVTHSNYRYDIDAMIEAANCLLGEHDFSAFRSSQCQATNPQRSIERIKWFTQGELNIFEIKANAFLHHMVRNIMGSLFEVGRGAQSIAWLAQVLESRDRTLAGATAPPWGLYLVRAEFDESFDLPAYPLGPMFLGL